MNWKVSHVNYKLGIDVKDESIKSYSFTSFLNIFTGQKQGQTEAGGLSRQQNPIQLQNQKCDIIYRIFKSMIYIYGVYSKTTVRTA